MQLRFHCRSRLARHEVAMRAAQSSRGCMRSKTNKINLPGNDIRGCFALCARHLREHVT
jgi:hypothetical protein